MRAICYQQVEQDPSEYWGRPPQDSMHVRMYACNDCMLPETDAFTKSHTEHKSGKKLRQGWKGVPAIDAVVHSTVHTRSTNW